MSSVTKDKFVVILVMLSLDKGHYISVARFIGSQQTKKPAICNLFRLQTPVFGHFLYLTIDELLIEGTFLWKFTFICQFQSLITK